MDALAIEEGALARQRPVGLLLGRAFQHAGQRAAVLDHGDADTPGMQSVEKTPRSVDRIDDEGAAGRKPGMIVGGLLRQPAVIRPCLEQGVAQIGVGGMVGLADWRGAALHPHLRVVAEIAHGDGAGLAGGITKQIEVLARPG